MRFNIRLAGAIVAVALSCQAHAATSHLAGAQISAVSTTVASYANASAPRADAHKAAPAPAGQRSYNALLLGALSVMLVLLASRRNKVAAPWSAVRVKP